MPENLLGLLKLCLVALLYLFFLRVLWAVWSEIRGTQPAREHRARKGRRGGAPTRLVIAGPPARKGAAFELGPEITVGRAAGCHIALADDSYVSQLHARVYQRDGQTFVEDLGSTNGTYLNGHRLTGPSPVRRGDSLQIGSTVLEVV